MKLIKILISLIIVLFFSENIVNAQKRIELNTELMNSTFKIEGLDGSIGTVFILGKPLLSDSLKKYRYVLITANHVLNDMKGDSVILYFREQNNYGEYKKIPYKIRIRENKKPLWIKHDFADIAVMYISIPKSVSINLLSINILATDEIYNKIDIHPGDAFLCLGYPLGQESNEFGFPILRKGILSSYPVVPMKKVKEFLLDLQIFKGNSGGPVYFAQSGRTYRGKLHAETTQFIAGLISKERINVTKTTTPYKVSIEAQQLGLAIVIPAAFIKETIDNLP